MSSKVLRRGLLKGAGRLFDGAGIAQETAIGSSERSLDGLRGSLKRDLKGSRPLLHHIGWSVTYHRLLLTHYPTRLLPEGCCNGNRHSCLSISRNWEGFKGNKEGLKRSYVSYSYY